MRKFILITIVSIFAFSCSTTQHCAKTSEKECCKNKTEKVAAEKTCCKTAEKETKKSCCEKK
jgi:hypothetical protein